MEMAALFNHTPSKNASTSLKFFLWSLEKKNFQIQTLPPFPPPYFIFKELLRHYAAPIIVTTEKNFIALDRNIL
jgi:hypothetical protein